MEVFFDGRSYFILFRVMLLFFVPHIGAHVGRVCGYLTWNQTSWVERTSHIVAFVCLEGFVWYFAVRFTKQIRKSQGAVRKDWNFVIVDHLLLTVIWNVGTFKCSPHFPGVKTPSTFARAMNSGLPLSLFPALIAPSGMLLPVVFTHDAILGCLIQIQNTRTCTCTFNTKPLHTT